jgi:hypothetical protein
MNNRYILYLVGMGLLALLLLLSDNMALVRLELGLLLDGSNSVQPELLTLFAIFAHIPAVLTVALQNALLGKPSGMVGRYPEIIVPLLVLITWAMAAVSSQVPTTVLVAGVVSATALGACYAAVRIVVAVSGRTKHLSSHVPDFSTSRMQAQSARSIYGLRVVMALVSFYALITLLHTAANVAWIMFVAVLVISAVAALGWLAIKAEQSVARRTAKTATQALSARLRVEPAEVALYYSGAAKAKHASPVKLAQELAKENMPPVIIAREEGAIKTLVKAPHRHLWLSPTINTLDAMAQPALRVIFYVNDAAKNGHFIRFNEFAHVMQATGPFANMQKLPRNCRMYDMIIAPDTARADLWRSAADPDMASRIVTLNPIEEYEKAHSYPSACPVMTLHLGTPSSATCAETPDLSPFLEMLPRLIALVKDCAIARLEIWLPDPAQGTSDPMLRLLHREVEVAIEGILDYDEENDVFTSPVSLHTGTPNEAANAADFPIVTAQSNLNAMRRTAKPLLWFDPAPAPEDVQPLGITAEDYTAALDAIWTAPTAPSHSRDETSATNRHFTSYAALIAAVTAQKLATTAEGGA